MANTILIYIEKDNDSYVELSKKAQELASKFEDCEVIGFSILRNNFDNTYFDKIYFINDERLKDYSNELYSNVIINFVRDVQPNIMLISATVQGRELAPQIASSLETGLTADCTDLDINENGKLCATRPTFGGKLMATILSKNTPQMATVRPNAIKTDFNARLKDTEYIEIKPHIENLSKKIELLDIIKKEIKPSIENASIIVAAGRGMKDNLDLLYRFAEKIGASVGVSRALVDLGLASSDIQIGQTGKCVSPNLYIALGISGSIQHTVGIMGAKKVIAINKDKDAPIFKMADFGIVADAVEILKEYIKN